MLMDSLGQEGSLKKVVSRLPSRPAAVQVSQCAKQRRCKQPHRPAHAWAHCGNDLADRRGEAEGLPAWAADRAYAAACPAAPANLLKSHAVHFMSARWLHNAPHCHMRGATTVQHTCRLADSTAL